MKLRRPLPFVLALVLSLVPGAVLADPPSVFRSPDEALKSWAKGVSAAHSPPGRVSADWWAAARQEILHAEYQVSWQEQTGMPDLPAAFQAPNRAQDLRTYFTPTGILVVPRTGGVADWRWGLATIGPADGGGIVPLGGAEPAVAGDRVEYGRETLREGFVNGERGLEQRLTLLAPPAVAPPPSVTALELAVSGDLVPSVREGGRAVEFAAPGAGRVLRYGDLQAHDAAGQILPASVGLSGSDLRLTVHTRGAVYPIGIRSMVTSPTAARPQGTDPLFHDSSWASWTAESDQASASFGFSVGTAGDVNGDGFSDVIVGAYSYDNGQSDEGKAFVYQGSQTGLSATPSWTAVGNKRFTYFGYSVDTAGDVNADGFSDVIVGAIFYDGGQTDEGRAFGYHGSAAGLSATHAWTAEGNQAAAQFGVAVGTAGDVNGDGFSDVVVGAYGYDNREGDEGRVFVYHGSAAGLGTTPAWTAEGDQAGGTFGYSVSRAGDVNGDGFSDVIVGAYAHSNGQSAEGRAFVFHGSAAGLSGTPAWTAESDQDSALFGISVHTSGDVNGDGFADVVVGSMGYDNGQADEGRAFVYHGSAAGLGTTPAWTAESDQAGANLGNSVGTAGDVNDDGFADLIVGAVSHDNGELGEGGAFAYNGSATGLSPAPDWSAEGGQEIAYFGHSVAAAGDVNGDGFSDVIVGASLYDNGEADEGRTFVYHGSSVGLRAPVDDTDYSITYDGWRGAEDPRASGGGYRAASARGETISFDAVVGAGPNWTGESDQGSAVFGWSVSTAGDVNGDGYSDVIVGALDYDNGQTDEGKAFVYHGSSTGLSSSPDWTSESDQAFADFGWSVGTAGDVNGDGYSDAIVGATSYDRGQTDEGRAFVYHGSAAGLGTTPAWTAESDQNSARFGRSVGTAGDVDGDGFDDVIVGANSYDNGQGNEGRAFVYHGSVGGLGTAPDWTAEGDQFGANFGIAVGTAGDVDSDGFSDVIVGADHYDGGQAGGRAFVYYGSAGGLSTAPDWTADGDQPGAFFGASVDTAGDVNGDGFADVIVGAYLYDKGQTDEGRAFVYHGSSGGLGITPSWSAESDQGFANLGVSVSQAGDVNRDGFSDVIVGASTYESPDHNEGRAFVYHGSSAGLTTAAAWTADADQSGSWFGNSVSEAGDVNDDGYADVIVGAWGNEDGQINEGRSFVYYGSKEGLGSARVAIVSYRGPDQGLALVSADGVRGVIDLYAPAPQYRYRIDLGLMSFGPHTLSIQALGRGNPFSSKREVRVDAFRVGGVTTEDNAPEVQYNTWKDRPGVGEIAFGGSFRQTGTRGGSVYFSFTGREFLWLTARGPEFGQADVFVDKEFERTVDLYNPTFETYEQPIGELLPGTHTVQIRVRGASSGGDLVAFDGYFAP